MKNAQQQTQSTLVGSITVAAFLFLVKGAAAFYTNSMSIMASALDSLLDVGSSALNLFASRKASRPPDDDHAYGHEKIESLAALFQSTFIALSGLVLAGEALRRFFFGTMLKGIPEGMAVMLFSMGVTSVLSWRLARAAQKTGSLILTTEKVHYVMDLLTNGGAFAALLLVKATNQIYWDLILSIAASAVILKTAFQILKKAVDELLDRSLPPVSKKDIEQLILSFHPSIVGLHNFRSRQAGRRIFLDFHIEIRGEEDFRRAHLKTESLLEKIREKYPTADITVHYDPEGEN